MINSDAKRATDERSQLVYDERAKRACEYFVKSILAISLASIAIFFNALTHKVEPSFSEPEKLTLMMSMLAMFASTMGVFIYVFAWYKKNSIRAWKLRTQRKHELQEAALREDEKSVRFMRKFGTSLSLLGISFGLVLAIVFMWMRIQGM